MSQHSWTLAYRRCVPRRLSPPSRVGRQGVDAEAAHGGVDPHLLAVAPHHVLVDRGGVERLGESAGDGVLDRTEQRARQIVPMPGGVQVGVED